MLIIVCMAVIRVCMYYILSQVKVKKEFLWINQINWRNKKPLNFTKNFQPEESFTFTEARKQNTHTQNSLFFFLQIERNSSAAMYGTADLLANSITMDLNNVSENFRQRPAFQKWLEKPEWSLRLWERSFMRGTSDGGKWKNVTIHLGPPTNLDRTNRNHMRPDLSLYHSIWWQTNSSQIKC